MNPSLRCKTFMYWALCPCVCQCKAPLPPSPLALHKLWMANKKCAMLLISAPKLFDCIVLNVASQIVPSIVVYFDQGLGAAHPKHWSVVSISVFFLFLYTWVCFQVLVKKSQRCLGMGTIDCKILVFFCFVENLPHSPLAAKWLTWLLVYLSFLSAR